MRKSLEQLDADFLEQLQRLGTASVQEICDAVGVTATAVRQRLVRLLAEGFVARELVRAGRGRPRYMYHVSEEGLRQLGDNYSDLAMILWRALRNVTDGEIRADLARRVRSALVARFGVGVHGPRLEDRFRQLQAALVERGFDVEVDSSSGLPILREKSCPYQELASSDRAICELEEEVFQQVLGVPVELSQCRLDGHSCCEFVAIDAGGEASG